MAVFGRQNENGHTANSNADKSIAQRVGNGRGRGGKISASPFLLSGKVERSSAESPVSPSFRGAPWWS